ncbi:MAG: hypothetical protein MUE85_15150 [Microscillaceae bacterium]|nr:hypothetical protein [Microscillaceae bacterium]
MIIKYLAIFLHSATHAYTPFRGGKPDARNSRHKLEACASFFIYSQPCASGSRHFSAKRSKGWLTIS